MANPVQAAVEVATTDEFFRSLNSVPGQLPGETIEEWLSRTEFERVVAQGEAEGAGAASPLYRWDYSAEQEFDRVVRETTADGAWQNWGGQPTPQGAAAPAPSTQATPQTPIKEAGAAGASVGGLLSVPLPTWVAAAAPLLGVAIGAGLYELSPEFWTKASQTFLPWCYEDSQAMPVITDKDGNTYIDKDAVEALKRLLDEEGIGGKPGEYEASSPIATGVSFVKSYTAYNFLGDLNSYDKYVFTALGAGTYILHRTGAGSFPGFNKVRRYHQTSDERFRYHLTQSRVINGEETITYDADNFDTSGEVYTYDGERARGGAFSYDMDCTQYTTETYPTGAQRWTTVFGDVTQKGNYIPGTSQWQGQTVDISQLPITEAYTDPTGSDTRDFIPAALPTTPGVSVDAQTNPNPTKNEDPEKQISPYINPSISQEQYPSGSESTGEDGEELDKSAPIPLPYPPTQNPPNPEDDPSSPDDIPPQQFVDVIPPIDSGDITFSPVPTFGAPTDGGVGGLVSVYNPTYSELQAFSNWLWVTYQDATIDKIWNNPFDGIIALYEIYATPVEGARKYIKSGFLVSTVECATLPQRYIEINCGTAVFPEYYGNYLDYSPYSKAMCYLPFIGIVELNVDDIVGHAVNITYRVDVYTGGCIAIITCAREGSNVAMYQFSGNCSVQLPIAGGTQSAIRAAQISAGAYQNAYHTAGLAGLAGGLASALFGGANFITGPVSGISQFASSSAFGQATATSQTVSAKSSVQHSGQFGESYGAMGHKKPYMIIKRPVQVIVPGYQQVYGFQAHKMVQIGSCTGFLRCRAVHVLSAQATDEEKSMIEQLLVSGVYVTEE